MPNVLVLESDSFSQIVCFANIIFSTIAALNYINDVSDSARNIRMNGEGFTLKIERCTFIYIALYIYMIHI